ncbi:MULTISPECIES: SLAC1 anion channel family protein [unclassified Variovorax]|uniref:SLAC1 anion channel family protein n=1 Tax=unclassified Variovorax TaxID=663243 RepID=UPI000F7E6CA3|nr:MULTISPECIES: SLAC1 anion channel family protein [unclassified Variovorax]RSZ45915.1 C4-dicarboxylate ABC transporter [Variovorax sp. 553]RSZ46631.1 C4-dicarboxylate ABC transporter [Variovorax sp. 679]
MQSQSLNPSSSVVPPRAEASVRNLPVNLFASVMGLSGLALAWRLVHESLGVPAFVGEAVGAFALFAFVLISAGYLMKLVRHRQAVQAEFNHPVAGNFFGTIAISVLLLSVVIAPYNAPVAHFGWTVGLVATFALSFIVLSRLLKGQVDASLAVPAWIIPGVATLDIPVTGAHMPMAWAGEINLAASAVGAVLALVLFTMIIGRLVHRDPLAPAMEPSLMILVAPFAVGFLAYTNVVGEIDRFAAMLFYFGLFIFAVVAPKVFRRGATFSPNWWAIGFPMAALANAALKYAELRASVALWVVALVLLAALNVALAVLTVKTVRIALNGKLFA